MQDIFADALNTDDEQFTGTSPLLISKFSSAKKDKANLRSALGSVGLLSTELRQRPPPSPSPRPRSVCHCPSLLLLSRRSGALIHFQGEAIMQSIWRNDHSGDSLPTTAN